MELHDATRGATVPAAAQTEPNGSSEDYLRPATLAVGWFG